VAIVSSHAMRALVLEKIGEPQELLEVPDPSPGPGQVRIAMRASGLCGTDLHVLHGDFPVRLPAILGHEPVGVVDAVGPGVTRLAIGDRVGVSWWQGGCGRCVLCQRSEGLYCRASKSWTTLGGGNAELMIAEDAGCTILPDAIGFSDAAPLFCAGYTVMSGYRNASPRPGDRIAVLGLGGLGHLALQCAKAMGHEVIAMTSKDKRALAKELGADEVVIANDDHAGRALYKAGGADILLSTSNSAAKTSEAISGLRPEGRCIVMALGGALAVDPGLIIGKQLRIQGSMQNRRQDLMDVIDLVATKRVRPMLEPYPFDRAEEAIDRLERGRVRFRAVLQHEAS
jgi:D-arabinose 1-dehydrogenase-like Zn-dependent alcohol dehydrogenase